jgi:hypothetical protein
MSSTVAIIAATSAGNSAAIAAAERAHDMSCQALIQGFDAKGATTQAQIAYADCVQRLNPQDITGDGKVALAIIMVSLIAGFVIGAIKSDDFLGDDLVSRFLGGLVGLSLAFVAGMLIVGLLYGLMLLFS